MNKRLITIVLGLSLVTILIVFSKRSDGLQFKYQSFKEKKLDPASWNYRPEGDESEYENPIARAEFEFNQLKDPKTGKIPDMIRQRELNFADEYLVRETITDIPRFQSAQSNSTNATAEADFQSFGPVNLAGRTRALEIDVTNENILLAGGVSGGVWRSTDQGASWTRTTLLEQHPAVTDLVQDRREGKTNIWYYSTGEMLRSSAAINSDFYYGNGIYKSEDNGQTWNLIQSTAVEGTTGSDPITGPGDFTLVDQLVIDYTNPEGTEIYAAGLGKIIRSTDGFETYDIVLGESNSGDNWTDIVITSTGKLFANIANLTPNGANAEEGLYESEDGINWTKIDFPESFPSTFVRAEMAIDPQNENRLYFVSATNEDLENSVNVGHLLLYDDDTDTWTDLTENMGLGFDFFNDHYTQFGYDLFIAVHPANDQIIFLGGVNLLRSVDGFSTSDERVKIGGYNTLNDDFLYTNQHPDQHSIVFFPSDANKMIVGTDGGLHLTTDNAAAASSSTVEPVDWQSLNNGYLTTQFYHLDIHNYDRGDDQIVGGMQDNSTFVKFGPETDEEWVQILTADGAYSGITYNSLVGSTQLSGAIVRFELVGNIYSNPTDISPDGDQNSSEFLFVNPLIYNPVAQDQYFLASRGKVYFTNDARENPGEGEWDEIRGGALPGSARISALAMSHQPEGVLYFGTTGGALFKVEDTRGLEDGTSPEILNTGPLPGGNVAAIAVDPSDADKVVVVISNYNVISVWYSQDGGSSWSSISGNLEENPDGTGAGPSVRAFAIMPDGNGGNYYFAGTSVGLYMTQNLDGDNTVWVQQAPDQIGQVVVSWISTRPIDGTVAISTHGNGVFKAQYEVGLVPNINYSVDSDPKQITIRGNLSYDASTPYAYQWIKDGEDLPNTNGDTFVSTESGTYQLRLALQGGTTALSNTIEFEGDDVTAIDDQLLGKIEEIIVDANPSKGVFNLAFPNEFIGEFELAVVNADGNRVMLQKVSDYASGDQFRLDLTSFSDGLYVVNVANENIRASVKLVKQTR